MNKSIFYLITFFISLVVYCCTQNKSIEEQPDRADAFLKVSEKSKSLFTKQARINNYKNSIDNNNNLKSSLEKNYKYSGYGSSRKKDSKSEDGKKNKDNDKVAKKVIFKKSPKNTVFSAYSTN